MTMQDKRHFLASAAALGLAGALPRLAFAQARFPSKPLKIVVPYAGGGADLTARIVAKNLSASLGKSVIVDNRPGAGGVVAGELVARAEPDGHTLLLVSSGTAVSQALFKSQPFDALKDFAWISTMASFDLAIVVAQNSRFKTLAEMLAYAKANPGKLNIGTPQIGTTQNLAAELFKSSAGIDAQVVPFNGTPPMVTALRGGQLDAGLDILGPLMPQLTSKSLRALAVLGDKRAPQLQDVPTARSPRSRPRPGTGWRCRRRRRTMWSCASTARCRPSSRCPTCTLDCSN
jgi:tripartite-type tricarboxylate transporter receptor subunit TctC